MADIFISYSRKDKAFVQKLTEGLSAPAPKGLGFDVWVDWEDIPPSAAWLSEIYAGIEGADNFIFIISPDSVSSEVCGWELAHAVQHHKRIIPVVYRDAPDVPPSLSALNYIFLRTTDDQRAEYKRLVTALRTDLTWVKAHTRLEVRAVEWQANNRDASFCLQGKDLDQASAMLATAQGKQPEPTALQTAYVEASTRNRVRRRRITRGLTFVAAMIMVVLGGLFLAQTRQTGVEAGQRAAAQATALAEGTQRAAAEATAEAEAVQRATQQVIAAEQSQLALSRRLGQEASLMQTDRLDLALLLAAEAYQMTSGDDARAILASLLSYSPYLERFLHGHTAPVTALGFDPEGRTLASADEAGTIRLWDIPTGRALDPVLTAHTAPIIGVYFYPPNQIISGDSAGNIFIWNRDTGSIDTQMTTSSGNMLTMGVRLPWEGEGATVFYAHCLGQDESGYGCNQVGLNEYNLKSAQMWNTVTISDYIVGAVAFDGEGQHFAIGRASYAGERQPGIAIFNPYTGEVSQKLAGHSGYPGVYSLGFTPFGEMLVSGSCRSGVWGAASNPDSCQVGDIMAWDTVTGEAIGSFATQTEYITHVAGNPLPTDGRLVTWGIKGRSVAGAASIENNSVSVWFDLGFDIAATNVALAGHAAPVTALAYGPGNRFLVSGGEDGSLIVWNLMANAPLGREYLAETEWLFGASFSPDASRLAYPITEDQFAIVDVLTNEYIEFISPAENVIFSPDGTRLAIFQRDSGVSLRQIDGTTLEFVTDSESGRMAFSPDGSKLAVDEGSGVASLWELTPPPARLVRRVNYAGGLTRIQFTSDSSQLGLTSSLAIPEGMQCCRRWVITTVDIANNEAKYVDISTEAAFGLSPDGQRIALMSCKVWESEYTCDDGIVSLVPVDAPLSPGQTFDGLMDATFSPDGSRLAGSDGEGYIRLYDTTSGALLWTSSDNPADTVDQTGAVFNADGSLVAYGDFTGEILVWDAQSGAPLYRFPNRFIDLDLSMLEHYMRGMVFSPVGNRLAAYGHGITTGVILWDFDLKARACHAANRNLTPDEWTQFLGDTPYRETCSPA